MRDLEENGEDDVDDIDMVYRGDSFNVTDMPKKTKLKQRQSLVSVSDFSFILTLK